MHLYYGIREGKGHILFQSREILHPTKKMKIYYFLKFHFDVFFTSGDVKQKVL